MQVLAHYRLTQHGLQLQQPAAAPPLSRARQRCCRVWPWHPRAGAVAPLPPEGLNATHETARSSSRLRRGRVAPWPPDGGVSADAGASGESPAPATALSLREPTSAWARVKPLLLANVPSALAHLVADAPLNTLIGLSAAGAGDARTLLLLQAVACTLLFDHGDHIDQMPQHEQAVAAAEAVTPAQLQALTQQLAARKAHMSALARTRRGIERLLAESAALCTDTEAAVAACAGALSELHLHLSHAQDARARQH